MATIRFHHKKWQAQIRLTIGPCLTRSFHQKADAIKWARATESDIQAGRYILAIETGMRKGELLGLTWRDIDMQRGEAYLGMTKNGLARMVPLSPVAQQTIKGLADVSGNTGSEANLLPLSVPLLRYLWDKLTKQAGAEDFHVHDLRREAVSRLFEYGLPQSEGRLVCKFALLSPVVLGMPNERRHSLLIHS